MTLSTLRLFLHRAAIPPCPILVAVSGGFDSTALLLAMCDLQADNFTIRAAHVNHHLRGVESDADEQFLRDLCARLDVPLDVADGTLDETRVRHRGIEAAARAIRYQRLLEMRARAGARYVATAHQKDDQAETVLMRILNGSGINGLRGIHPIRNDGFIRPLLDVTRAEIESYLRERGVVPRIDRTNDDPRFLRNRVRVLIRDLGATNALAALAGEAREQWPLIETVISRAERDGLEIGPKTTRFVTWPDNFWLRGALLQRHIRRLDPDARDFDAERLAREISTIRRTSVTKNLELVRQGETLLLREKPQITPHFETEAREDTPTHIPEIGKTIHLAKTHTQPATSNRQLIQVADDADCRWLLRNRRPGDRFQPLGMAHAKKLKDFLIDRKIPAEVRDRIPLLVLNGEIVWVAGVEISERFKVTDSVGVLYEVWMEDAGAADHDDQSRLQR